MDIDCIMLLKHVTDLLKHLLTDCKANVVAQL